MKDFADTGLLELNESVLDDEKTINIPANLHRDNEGHMNGNYGQDTLHHLLIDTSPPSTFARNIKNKLKHNPHVSPEIIIEDQMKISYVKIDWGNGNKFEKKYNPPVDKVVESETYEQEFEDKEYTIRVQAFDGAGNEQNNITIDGEEYPEITFSVLALKPDYPVGLAVNKKIHDDTDSSFVTAFRLNPCGQEGKRVGRSVAQLQVGKRPFDVAARGDGRIYVTNSDPNARTLTFIDTQYDPETDTFEFEYGPDNEKNVEYDPK